MKTPQKRLTLFAMTKKGLEVLRALTDFDPDLVAAVVCVRGEQTLEDHYENIENLFKTPDAHFEDRQDFTRVTTDYALAVSWRWLIKPSDAYLVVLHDSLLPAYRGFNPLVTALINGDEGIDVTTLYTTDYSNPGEIIFLASIPVTYTIRLVDPIEASEESYASGAIRIAQPFYSSDFCGHEDE